MLNGAAPMTPPPQALPDVAAQPALSRFWSGASFAASGIPTTLSTPRLFALSLVPIAVQCALFVALVWAGLSVHDDLVARLGVDGDGWFAVLVRGVVEVLLYALIAVVGLLLVLFLGSIVLDPFYDLLSEIAEERIAGKSFGEPFTIRGILPGIVREAGATLVRLAVYVPVALAIWVFGFIPVVGVLAVPLGLSWTFLFACYEVLVRSLARHGLPASARLKVLFSHKALALGFGAGAWVAALIPFLTPFLVVGATRMYLSLAAHGRVPSRLDDAARRALQGAP